MNYKETWAKFGKGALSGGGAALGTFFFAQGCKVTTLKEFGVAASFAALSGAFHAVVNLYKQSKTTL